MGTSTSSLNLYDYNSKEIGTNYENVDILFNSEQISRSSTPPLGIQGLIAPTNSKCAKENLRSK